MPVRSHHLPLFALLLFSLLAGCAPQGNPDHPRAIGDDGTETLTLTVPFETASGCRMKGGEVRLIDSIVAQDDPDRIVLEAEEALNYEFQQGIGLLKSGRDTSAGGVVQIYARDDYEYSPQEADEGEPVGGGAYIDYTHQADYLFRVTQPGEYTLWARHYLPRKGGWVYRHQVDGGEVKDIWLSSLPDKVWFWTKCGTYDLDPGTHTFTLTNLHGGKRVDRLVFSKDPGFAPEGDELGPEATPRKPVEEGHVISEPMRLIGGGWPDTLKTLKLSGEGEFNVWVSADSGKSWFQAKKIADAGARPEDVRVYDLIDVLAPWHGRDDMNTRESWEELTRRFKEQIAQLLKAPILVQVQLRNRGEQLARITSAQLTCSFPADRFAVLENEHLRLRFDRATGALCGIENLDNGQQVQAPGLLNSAFDIHLKRPPKEVGGMYPKAPLPEGVTLSASDARIVSVDADRDSIETVYSLLNGKLRLTTRTAIDNTALSRWSITVDNDSDLDVQWVRYPKIERVVLGEASSDDVLCWPRVGGEMIVQPSQKGAWSLAYPGRASLSYFDLFDDKGGLYVAVEDADLIASELEMTPRIDAHHVDLSTRKLHRVRGGETYTWNFVVAPHAGDWHWAADRYREYFHRTFGKPDYPDWLLECDGWIASSPMYRRFNRTTYFDEMRHGPEVALRYGYRYVQHWSTVMRNACPGYYLPLKEYGGAESFTRANRWWHERGGIMGYYFHGNSLSSPYIVSDTYWTTPWSEYPEEVRPPSWSWYVRNRWYPTPDMEVSREEIVEQIDRELTLARKTNGGKGFLEKHVKMTFADDAYPDYQYFWAVEKYNNEYMADVIYWDTFAWGGERQEYNPYYKCFGEGNTAPARRAHLRRCIDEARKTNPDYYQLTEGCVDVYGTACYHMISGFSRNPEIFRYTLPEQVVFEGHQNGGWGSYKGSVGRIETAFLYGNKFDMLSSLIESNYLKEIVSLRKWLTPWLNASRFMDRQGVSTSTADVQVIAHRVKTDEADGLIVTLRNLKSVEGATVAVDYPELGRPKMAIRFRPGHEPDVVKTDYRGGKLHLPVPAEGVSAYVLVRHAAGSMAWHASAFQRGVDGVAVRLINFGAEPVTAQAACEGMSATLTAPAMAFDRAPVATHLFAPDDRLARDLPEKIDVAVTVDGERRELFQGWYPAAYDRSFERAGVEHPEARDGKKLLKLEGGGRHRVNLDLTPGRTYRVTFQIKQQRPGTRATISHGDKAPRFGKPNHENLTVPNQPGQWVTATGAVTPTGDGYMWIRAAKNSGVVLVDDVRVEEVE